MFVLKSMEEAFRIIQNNFPPSFQQSQGVEMVPLLEARGRILAQEICATEYVPSFHRSSVDGYAVRASDTFGSSDSIPAMLPVQGHILMGEEPKFTLHANACATIATGGALPEGADAVQMIEYTEDYGDGTIGILKAVAPQQHIVFKGDDVYPGKLLLKEGTCISPKDIGALAALGICEIPVRKRITVGIITTGDELVPIHEKPNNAQVRTVNTSLLASLVAQFGENFKTYGIIKDKEELLQAAVATASAECDVVLISGGSSVGVKDVTSEVIAAQGEVFFHGVALKPGKPTIFGRVHEKPVFGLPGHPVAVFFVTLTLVYHLLSCLTGKKPPRPHTQALLTESVEANHGRTQFVPISFTEENGQVMAQPIRNKSGLITTLTGAQGYFIIPQECEGFAKHTPVTVYLF